MNPLCLSEENNCTTPNSLHCPHLLPALSYAEPVRMCIFCIRGSIFHARESLILFGNETTAATGGKRRRILESLLLLVLIRHSARQPLFSYSIILMHAIFFSLFILPFFHALRPPTLSLRTIRQLDSDSCHLSIERENVQITTDELLNYAVGNCLAEKRRK